jgi:hypothetical protein
MILLADGALNIVANVYRLDVAKAAYSAADTF